MCHHARVSLTKAHSLCWPCSHSSNHPCASQRPPCPSCWLCLPRPPCPTQTICRWAPPCPSYCQHTACAHQPLPGSGTSAAWTSRSHAGPSVVALLQLHLTPLTDLGLQATLPMIKNILISTSPPLLKLSPRPRAFSHSHLHRFWASWNPPLSGSIPGCPNWPLSLLSAVYPTWAEPQS